MNRLLAMIALSLSASASAVGLGPLAKQGITDGPGKAFYLTLINPYPKTERFTIDSHNVGNESPADRITIFPADTVVAANGQRQLLVIARDLAPGETRIFRVCAQRPPRAQETVHARVCSTLTARRLAPRRVPGRGASDRIGSTRV
jgi:hypothetical protein